MEPSQYDCYVPSFEYSVLIFYLFSHRNISKHKTESNLEREGYRGVGLEKGGYGPPQR